MDAIYGVTMEMLADIFSKDGELRAKHGEKLGREEFERYLASKGLDWNVWAMAHNAWHDRFRADPTGRSEAQFHMMLSQRTARAHFGDVRDMSADREEGITLDTYAQITVAVSRVGTNIDELVRQHGLTDVAHWQRANAAWTKKMGEDTTHALTMQYGQLYQKYAGPSFQEQMLDQTAGILAAANAPQDVVDEPEEELTPQLCLEKMKSPSRNERWRYARHYAHMADLGNVPDKRAAIATVEPILLEMIERHDEHTTSDAEDGARKLWDLEVRSDDFRGAVGRCLNRAREKLQSLRAAFAPIQDQAVPERITLQSRIQDYESLVETMTGYANEDWSSGAAPPGLSAPTVGASPSFGAPGAPIPFHTGGSSPSFGSTSTPPIYITPPAGPPRSSGGLRWLIGPMILVLVIGGVVGVRMRARARANASAHAVTSASVSANASTTAPSRAATPPSTRGGAAAAAAPSSTADEGAAASAASAKKARAKRK
jgi:hypothetical protein